MKCDLQIMNGQSMYLPVVEEDIQWATERKGVPGKLTFNVYRDKSLKLEEGSPVKFIVDGTPIFYGFLFKTTGSKDKIMTVTAYDQTRYLKNKDTYVFKAAKASDIIVMICDDYGIRYGNIADTEYTIASRTEDNQTLFDMIQTALEITTSNIGKVFTLYDLAGRLTLTKLQDMTVNLLIDAETGETYNYTSTIDDETYNRVKLVYEDTKTKKRQIFVSEDKSTQKKWGTLQYFEAISDTQNAQNKANILLKLYNRKTKRLTVTGCFGDLRVRAGCLVVVMLDFGDTKVRNWMVVEKCTHIFKNNLHTMDLTLSGGDFIG